MATPFDIGEKFQEFIDAWTKGIQELADRIFGAQNDNENEPIFISNDLYCVALLETSGYTLLNNYDYALMCYQYDVKVHDNIITTSCSPLAQDDFNNRWSSLTPEQRAAKQDALDERMETFEVFQAHEGEVLCYYGAGNCTLTIRYGEPPANHDADVYKQAVKIDSSIVKSTNAIIDFYAIDYTLDANGYITPTNRNILGIEYNRILGLKGYPVLLTTDNDTFISNFISGNGSTNNYHDTYQTEGGDTIDIYYGDNYYIVKNNNNNTSYNDVKKGLDIAVNKIIEDNPDYPPIKVPSYTDNKYGPDPIESDNQEDGGNYNHAEFTKVYVCTSAELNNLYQWMGGGAAGSSGTSPITVPDNFDPMNRIVGLIGYPMKIDVGVGDATTFTFRNAANQTINTGWSTYKYGNFDREFDFGTVDIPNWEELENGAPFLDYSATVEIYIPFCGVVGLDPQAVMGCTLSCKMWVDFVTGDCSAVVYTNYGGEGSQHPVAFVSGNCGSAEVVSANAFGAYQGAKAHASHKMSQAILGGFKDLATSVIGGATTGFTRGAANPSGTGGNAGMRAGAIGSVIGGAMNLGVNLTLQNLDNRYAVQVAKNALGTTISGSFGQQTSWYYMDTPYIKVTWPTPISKDVELYGKTFGVPVHRSGTLNEFTGYTVCNNVDVSGIAGATASELAIIKQFLETGVFIKEGGEE